MRDHRFAHLSYVNGILSFNELFFIQNILNGDIRAFISNYLANTILSYIQHRISLILSKHLIDVNLKRIHYSRWQTLFEDTCNVLSFWIWCLLLAKAKFWKYCEMTVSSWWNCICIQKCSFFISNIETMQITFSQKEKITYASILGTRNLFNIYLKLIQKGKE